MRESREGVPEKVISEQRGEGASPGEELRAKEAAGGGGRASPGPRAASVPTERGTPSRERCQVIWDWEAPEGLPRDREPPEGPGGHLAGTKLPPPLQELRATCMETPAGPWSYLFSSLAGQSRRTGQAGAPRTAWIPLAVVSLEWDGDGELSSQGPPCRARGTGKERARVHSPGPPQLLGAPALRSTGGDNRRPSVKRGSRVLSPHQATPEPSLLPGHSCPGLVRRGYPGLPSLLFPGMPPGGLSAPGRSPRRCSDKKKERAVGHESQEARAGRMGEPQPELSQGTPPGSPPLSPHPHPLSPQPHLCGSFAPSSGDPIPALALSFLQEAALWGQARATFQTGVWEEVEGPAEGPSVPAVPATCTHCEDTPRGFGLQRPAPNTSFSAQGRKGAAAGGARPFADTLWGGAGPPAPPDPDCHGLPGSPTHGRVSLDPWAGAPAPRSLCTAQPSDSGWH